MANKKRTSNITPDQIIARRGTATREQAAAVVGFSPRQWSNFENGTTSMPDYLFAEYDRLAPWSVTPQTAPAGVKA